VVSDTLSNAKPNGISMSVDVVSSAGGKSFFTTLMVVLSLVKGR
jgi:hypothetical protein